MNLPNKYRVPGVTALWMIFLPAVFWFFGGAGLDTVFDFFAQVLNSCFSAFGGSSLFFGFLLLIWTVIEAWRDGYFAQDEDTGAAPSGA